MIRPVEADFLPLRVLISVIILPAPTTGRRGRRPLQGTLHFLLRYEIMQGIKIQMKCSYEDVLWIFHCRGGRPRPPAMHKLQNL